MLLVDDYQQQLIGVIRYQTTIHPIIPITDDFLSGGRDEVHEPAAVIGQLFLHTPWFSLGLLPSFVSHKSLCLMANKTLVLLSIEVI